jgi:hypothetical protein
MAMTAARWQLLEETFHAALELPEPDRPAWLLNTCPDPDIRQEVEAMLLADRTALHFEHGVRVAAASLLLSMGFRPRTRTPSPFTGSA